MERIKYQKGYCYNEFNNFYDNNYVDYVVTDCNLHLKIKKTILKIFKKKG